MLDENIKLLCKEIQHREAIHPDPIMTDELKFVTDKDQGHSFTEIFVGDAATLKSYMKQAKLYPNQLLATIDRLKQEVELFKKQKLDDSQKKLCEDILEALNLLGKQVQNDQSQHTANATPLLRNTK